MSLPLRVTDLRAGYGATVVLDDIGFEVPAGGSLAVLGRNGVGKSTLLATLMGFTTRHAGVITLGNTRLDSLRPFRRNRAGLGYVPQEREIFASLSVEENLAICVRAGGWTIERIYTLFPGLAQRRRNAGNKLSGGEQQMLAIGRALAGAPKLLLLDEPMEGLAPVIVDALYDALEALKRSGEVTLLVVEQKAELALRLTEQVIVLDRGRVIHAGRSADLLAEPDRIGRLLAVGEDAERGERTIAI